MAPTQPEPATPGAPRSLDLLLGAGTQTVVHDVRKGKARRSLLDHLLGTQELLQRGGYPEALCTAGLMHSVYGTNRFTLKSIDASIQGERERVRASAGQQAERLAYLFHSIQRPRVLHDFVQRSSSEHREGEVVVELEDRQGGVEKVSADEAWMLVALEMANLLEQGELFADRWPAFVTTEAYHRIGPAAVGYLKEKRQGNRGGRDKNTMCLLQ